MSAGEAGENEPVTVRIAHAAPGRLRLNAPGLVDEAEQLARFAQSLAELPALVHVSVRPRTASVILKFEGSAAALIEALAATGTVLFAGPAAPPIPVSDATRAIAGEVDRVIRKTSTDALDAESAIAVVLLGAAVFQALRGQLLGPTSTLLMSVLALLQARRPA